jgi:methionyl-tRNA formyltransferase
MRIIYLGSPEVSVFPLEYLLKNSDHQIIAVISQPPQKKGRGLKLQQAPVAKYAISQNIKAFCPAKVSAPEFIKTLIQLKPDLCITCAYGQILSQSFLDIPKYGTINIHPSALPKYRGATPIQSALANGDEKTAISILFTIKKMDAGPIIIQKEQKIINTETTDILSTRLFKESGPLLSESIEKVQAGFAGIPQDEDNVTLCRKITKEQGKIFWNENSKKIINKYRAFTPWPGVFSFYQNKRIVFSDLTYDKTLPKSQDANPGDFYFDKQSEKLIVTTNDATLQIGQIKKEGKSFCSAQDFYNGLSSKTIRAFSQQEEHG